MKYYLAPMEGLTTYNFRTNWNRCYGGMDKYFTPFISNRHMNSRERNDVLPEHNVGMYTVPQILTNKAEEFLSLAEQLAGYGYHEVNLNLGCPSGTVVARNRGAGFLGTPRELETFLDEIFEKCPLKISIKTRIGMECPDEWAPLLKIYQKFPMKELIIHPRLQKEGYKGTPHLEAFAEAVNDQFLHGEFLIYFKQWSPFIHVVHADAGLDGDFQWTFFEDLVQKILQFPGRA